MVCDKKFLLIIISILPKCFISRIAGYLARLPVPPFILGKVIKCYADRYKVNKNEIEYPEKGFKCFEGFFTRKLKEGVHVIDDRHESVISPVDAEIVQFGKIEKHKILQAKGIDFSLKDLFPSDSYEFFTDGDFITLYLSPADYHRIHSPVTGRITGYFIIPGTLFSVQNFSLKNLRNLYTKNERLISYIQTANGQVAVCKIGAMNVGRITVCHDNEIRTNKWFRKRKEFIYKPDERPIIKKGQELGIFHIGSTVILVFQKDMINFKEIYCGEKIRMGERIAALQKVK